MNTTKMHLTDDAENECTIAYVDALTDERVERTFWAPSRGGYVHEISIGQGGTASPQVCTNLAHMGDALMWSPGRGRLAVSIRRQYRAMRRAEARASR